MIEWEYCAITLGWPGGLGSGNWYIAYVTHYLPDGNNRVQEIKTGYKVTSDKAIHAMGAALSLLGKDGWELVSFQQETSEYGFTLKCQALLKRQLVAP